jgi:hypothetical protein
LRQVNSTLSDQEIDSLLQEDQDDPKYQLMSDEDIIQEVTSSQDNEACENGGEGHDEDFDAHISSAGEVAYMLEKCMDWYERQDENNAASILLLKGMRDLATTKRYSRLKQQKLQSFLTS